MSNFILSFGERQRHTETHREKDREREKGARERISSREPSGGLDPTT